jgi:hypothetical protein
MVKRDFRNNVPWLAGVPRNRPRKRVISVLTACDRPSPGGEPDFAPSSETPGGYVGQAAFQYRQLYRLAAGDSRERLKARQFYRTSYPCRTEQTRWANIVTGYSPEPHAATLCRPTARWYECRVVVWSRAKAAPLQTSGTNTPRQRATPFEYEDDDEDSLPDEALVSLLGRSVSERSRDYEAIPIVSTRTPD